MRRWELNQQICRICISSLGSHRGGAEVPASLLYTDVRDCTLLAETMDPAEIAASLNRFFSIVFAAVDAESGVIDLIVGDGVMAMWVPGFSGSAHADLAVAAGRRLSADLSADPVFGAEVAAGVGVHTGISYVGVVGEVGSLDFTVVGDTANTVARLGSSAAGKELLLSDEIVRAASVDITGLARRTLQLTGKNDPFVAWVETADRPRETARPD